MTEQQPALSPHIAHPLITECPRQAWAEHRLLGNCVAPSAEKLARMERGGALHNLVLEGGNKIRVVEADSWRTKDAQEQRNVARAAGEIPMLEKDMGDLEMAAAFIIEGLRTQLQISLERGTAEQKIYWHEPSSVGDVLCDGVIDWHDGHGGILDLKTTEGSVHPDACARAIVDSPAILQDCAYRNAVVSQDGTLAGRTSFTFVWAMSKEPYLVTCVRLDGAMQHIGETRWLRAIEVWAQCLSKGRAAEHWPQHTARPIEVHAPGWLLAKEMELEAAESG